MLAIERLGYEGRPTEFAVRIGLTGMHSPRRVANWVAGGNPDYEGTMLILDALGAINWAVLGREPVEAEDAVARAREVAAGLDAKPRRSRRATG